MAPEEVDLDVDVEVDMDFDDMEEFGPNGDSHKVYVPE
jgi:hypothetical protein